MAVTGDLAAVPVSQLLGTIKNRQATCQLILRSGNEDVRIFVQQGRIIRVTSSQARYRLGELLVQLGMLSPGQLTSAVEQFATEPGKRTLGAFLTSHGLVRPNDLADVLTYQAQHILSRVLTWRQGTYQLVMTLPEVDAVPLPDVNIAQLIGTPVQEPLPRRRPITAELVAASASPEGTHITLPITPAHIHFDPERTSQHPGAASFAEVLQGTPASQRSTPCQESTMPQPSIPLPPTFANTTVDDLTMARQLQELCTLARQDLTHLEQQLRQLLQQLEEHMTIADQTIAGAQPPASQESAQLEQIVVDGQAVARLCHSIASRHRLRHQLETALSLVRAEPSVDNGYRRP